MSDIKIERNGDKAVVKNNKGEVIVERGARQLSDGDLRKTFETLDASK